MSTVVSADGTTLAFDRRGDGPPVILVDGALCHRAFGPSAPLAARLAAHFTVYTYDRRGRGGSGDARPCAVEREVEDIQALIQAAGGSAYVYGASSGAALALAAAARLDGIDRLALYEAPFIVDGSREPYADDLTERMEGLVAAGRRGDAVKLFMRTVGTPRFAVVAMSLTPVWSKLKAVAHTLPYDFRILGDCGRGEPLPADRWVSATMPTLVLDGGKSPAWMRTAMRSLAEVLPAARYQTLPGQTHLLKPDAVTPVLRDFFR